MDSARDFRPDGLEFKVFASFQELIHGSFRGFDVSINENKEALKTILSVPHLIQSCQVHGDHIHVVNHAEENIPPCDALITQLPGIALLIKHADCQAALMYDPVQKVIAAIHAGFRGQALNLYSKVILKLQNAFGSQVKDIRVAISPSLGPNKAEFIHYKNELPEKFWKYQIKPNHFDLWAAASDEFIAAGLLPHHIEIAQVCTYENLKYFSYRRDKATGRQGSIIGLK